MSLSYLAKCQFCQKPFSYNGSLRRHVKLKHPEHACALLMPRLECSQTWCCLCSSEENKVRFQTYDLLIKHLSSPVHGIEIKRWNISFATEYEFRNWMSQVKKKTIYVKARASSSKVGLILKTESYVCNRSRRRPIPKSKSDTGPKRSLKAGGSNKVNGTCPSRIVAKFYRDVIKVMFTETHVGHEHELRACPLSEEEQRAIADQVRAGVPNSEILKEARIIKNGKLERINLLDYNDIRTIQKKFKINIGQRKAPDFKPDCRRLGHGNVMRTHREADKSNIMEAVEAVGNGKFRVKTSTSADEKYYSVSYGNVGICDCLGVVCKVCEMCVHRYKCECAHYTKRNAICKHAHMVAMFERRTRIEALVKRKKATEEYTILLVNSIHEIKTEKEECVGNAHSKNKDLNDKDLDADDDDDADIEMTDLEIEHLNVEDLKVEDFEIEDSRAGYLEIGDLEAADIETGGAETGDLETRDVESGDVETGHVATGDLETEQSDDHEETPQLSLETHRKILLEQIMQRSREMSIEDFIEAAQKFLEETKKINGCKKRKLEALHDDHTYCSKEMLNLKQNICERQ